MRKPLLGVLAVLFLTVFLPAQTRRVVDGIGGSGKYAKISDAITAAAAGDTIDILQGTYTEATTISVPKRLVLLGAGYRANGTVINNVQFSVTDAADNTKIIGFKFTGGGVTLESGADNVLIAESHFSTSGITMNGNTGDTIRNNIFIIPGNLNPIATSYNTSLTNILVCNNVFDGTAATNNVAAIYFRVQSANMSNVRIINNFFGETQYVIYGDWNAWDGVAFAGNVFYKVSTITVNNGNALLYSGNWLYNISGTPSQPGNGVDNGSGDPQFTRFDVSKGFVFVGDTAQDSDLRLKASASPFPNSLMDGSYRPIAPMPLTYVDVQQQPGSSNTNRADIGIFGGPFPFKSPFAPTTVPGVSSITAVSKATGSTAVSPKGTLQVSVTGSFGGTPEPKPGE